jgi:hypothetical protein
MFDTTTDRDFLTQQRSHITYKCVFNVCTFKSSSVLCKYILDYKVVCCTCTFVLRVYVILLLYY